MILNLDFSVVNQVLDLDFREQPDNIALQFDQVVEIVKSDANPYTGDYAVTPSVEGSSLPTKNKYMTDDVTVHPIPVFSVTNSAGGLTVYIAQEEILNG